MRASAYDQARAMATSSTYEPPGTASSTSRMVLKLAGEADAVFVRHPRGMIRRWHGAGAVDKHAQHPVLASAYELDVNDFESAGGRNAVGNSPNSIDLKYHVFNYLD